MPLTRLDFVIMILLGVAFVLRVLMWAILDDKNHESIKKIANYKHIKSNENLQWVLFSATFTTEDASRYEIVQERQSALVPKASQIKIQAEKLKLEHIR